MNKNRLAANILALALILNTTLISGLAYASKSFDINESTAKAEAPGIVKFWATMLKDKGKKFDIGLHIKNESDGYIIITLSDMGCARGNSEGVLKHTFFNTGERTIDFGPHQEKQFNLVCSETDGKGGTFTIKVNRVYDNPGHDRRTTGKVIASDLVWKYDAN